MNFSSLGHKFKLNLKNLRNFDLQSFELTRFYCSHHAVTEWQHCKHTFPRKKDIGNDPLVNALKMVSLHIKLGQMKNPVKAINQNGEGFRYQQ
jgi:hypothetical protein